MWSGFGVRGGAAHPRVSGENALEMVLASRFSGSSPRERGKPGPVDANVIGHRLIPA